MKIYTKQNVNKIIASYPRSGNHWTRYIIEYLSKRPTLGSGNKQWSTTVDGPIFKRLNKSGFYINNEDYIAVKTHKLNHKMIMDNEILLIVRNYKEVMIRRFGVKKSIDRELNQAFIDYMKLIELFDKSPNNKLLIYYEDLITNYEEVIPKMSDFFCLEKCRTKDFLSRYEFHRDECVKLYDNLNKSHTKGKSIRYHSNKVDNMILKKYDNHVISNWPGLYKKYLGDYSCH